MTLALMVRPRSALSKGCLAILASGMLLGCANTRAPSQPSSAISNATVLVALPQPQRQELQGQLSIKLLAFGQMPAKGLSLGFFFAGSTEAGQLDLITLMGSQLAQVNWMPDEVWLTDEKGKRRYASMDELSGAALGEALPLRALVHWMQGSPDPTLPSETGPQANSFTQLGWTIDLSERDSKKLTATRAATSSQRGVYVKVYLDR